jgi:hypothetical protein
MSQEIREKILCSEKMNTHLSGEFIAVLEIDAPPLDDFPVTDEGDRALRKVIVKKTLERADQIMNEIRERHGITLVFQPQYIEGGLIDL